METGNPTLVLHGIEDLRLEPTPIPEPGSGEVLIKIHSVGICATDVHFWEEGRVNDFIVTYPHVLGHEASGTVVATGPEVTNFKKGDRVTIEPEMPCMNCLYCKKGRYNLCPDLKISSVPPCPGAMRRYFVHPSSFCHKIPDNMSLEEAAVIEPLSVAIRACQRGEVTIGKTVLVTGAGPVGLLNMATAKVMGATKVYITDILQSRLDFAQNYGADETLLSDTKDVEELAKRFLKHFGEKVDIVLECSGAEASIQLGLSIIKPGGILVVVGIDNKPMTIPIVQVCLEEIEIRGSMGYVNCQPIAISLVASGKIDVKPLITNRVTLEEGAEAFKIVKSHKGGVLKVLINCTKNA